MHQQRYRHHEANLHLLGMRPAPGDDVSSHRYVVRLIAISRKFPAKMCSVCFCDSMSAWHGELSVLLATFIPPTFIYGLISFSPFQNHQAKIYSPSNSMCCRSTTPVCTTIARGIMTTHTTLVGRPAPSPCPPSYRQRPWSTPIWKL